MRVAVGADHGGYNLKQHVVEFLVDRGHQVEDLGTHSLESVDYPDVAARVARTVAIGHADRGIIVCGTGIGVSIVANKVPDVRAALCTNVYMARMAREHNGAQVLCLGERVLGVGLALDIVQVFLDTEFQGGRHARRVDKINALERKG
jgi:ribose 5-phosphate isomerase B